MKIRADFVTNSSSSCYVTIRIKTTDGTSYEGQFNGDEVGYGYLDNFISMYDPDEEKIERIKQAQSGADIIQAIDDMYDGMFTDFEETSKLFGDKQSTVETLDREKIDIVAIEELTNSDDGSDTGTLSINLSSGEIDYQRENNDFEDDEEDEGDENDSDERPLEDLREIIARYSMEDLKWAIEAINDINYQERAGKCQTQDELADVVIEYAKQIPSAFGDRHYPFPDNFCREFVDSLGEEW